MWTYISFLDLGHFHVNLFSNFFISFVISKGADIMEEDQEIKKEMSKLVKTLTSSGQPTLDEKKIKRFKQLCKAGDDYVRYMQEIK